MEGTLRTIIVPVALGVILVGCVSTEDYNRSQNANEALRGQLAALSEYQTSLEAENSRLSQDLIRVGRDAVDAAWIEQQKAKLDRLLGQFQDGGSLQGTEGVIVKQTSEGLVFQVQGEVLFESGKADVTSSGQETLRRLIPTLRSVGKRIRVDGHTDDDPILRSGWETNLHLSAGRALSVAAFLTANGLAEDIVSIGAFGEYRPTEMGNTPEVKRANRRVEILMVDG